MEWVLGGLEVLVVVTVLAFAVLVVLAVLYALFLVGAVVHSMLAPLSEEDRALRATIAAFRENDRRDHPHPVRPSSGSGLLLGLLLGWLWWGDD